MNANSTIQFIGEGTTDFQVIQNILDGILGSEITFTCLQPELDETDQQLVPGNWIKVLEYCKSEKFRSAFLFADYVIIQIDTDICQEAQIGIPNYLELPISELIEKVKQRLIQQMSQEFYKKHTDQIIFAIGVHSLECWILPLYISNNKAEKTVNCLGTLNESLKTKGYTIDKNKKNHERIYSRITKEFRKEKNIIMAIEKNESFQDFYQQIKNKSNN